MNTPSDNKCGVIIAGLIFIIIGLIMYIMRHTFLSDITAAGPGPGMAAGPGPGMAVGPGPGMAVGPGPGMAVGPGPGMAVGPGPGMATADDIPSGPSSSPPPSQM
jgi:hypothetical protein